MNLQKINIFKFFLICSIFSTLIIIIIAFSYLNSKNTKIYKPQSKIPQPLRHLSKHPNEIYSEKWVVVTTINAPTDSIKKLTELPEPWKIVVIGDKKTKNKEWDSYKNSHKLIFLSIKSQLNLNYKTTQYIPYNSYTRKNIGYLYAIEHGAKEIYETDDDNIFTTFEQLYQNYNETKISYAENSVTTMVNPYAYFGRPSVWPRGFRLYDINLDHEKKFYITNPDFITSKPLVYQGLANGDPDVDAIFRLTRANAYNPIRLDFYNMHPLLYFPGNYIPINSQNTRFLYQAFPAIALPTTVAFRVCDIWRGFILERFIWGYNGTVLFHKPTVFQKRNVHDYYEDFVDEEALYYGLEDILSGLNDTDIIKGAVKNPGEFLVKIIKNLVKKNVLKENDYKMYKAFIEDLESFGYNYEPNYSLLINNNIKDFLKSNSEIKFYLPRKQRELMGNNGKEDTHKILYHYPTKTIYNDILLIINFFDNNIQSIKDYMRTIYTKNFPNIIFISSLTESNNDKEIFYCPEAKEKELSYICINKIYKQYQNMKGYLYLTNKILLKIWELDYLDLDIPWFCSFNYTQNAQLENLLNSNNDYKINLEKFFGKKNVIAKTLPHFFYLSKDSVDKVSIIFEEFYKNKISQDFAIINAMGIALLPRYQYIYYTGINSEQLEIVMNHTRKANEQIFVYPIDYTRKDYREEVDKYYYFMKAEEFN